MEPLIKMRSLRRTTGFITPSASSKSRGAFVLTCTLPPHAAAGLLKIESPPEPELRDLLVRLELDLGAERGAVDGGEHMLAVLRKS